ncbi:MAG TPA: UDP binding domain-containing protein, partial [Longimicrobium sp.]
SEINAEMPEYVVQKVADTLNGVRKAVNGSRVLVLGVAYKRDIDDLRESPALDIIGLLQGRGAEVQYHDPFCPEIRDDGHTSLQSLPMQSQALTAELLEQTDVVVLVTDHTSVDYALVADHASLVVDTRGVMRGGTSRAGVVGLSGKGSAGRARAVPAEAVEADVIPVNAA